jgi:hypothetical protein
MPLLGYRALLGDLWDEESVGAQLLSDRSVDYLVLCSHGIPVSCYLFYSMVFF